MPVQPEPAAPQTPVQPAVKKSRKVLWIVLGVIGVIILLVGIGLYKVGKKVSEYVNVDNGQVVVKGDNGEKVSYGGSLPSDWPGDVPQYPGSTVGFTGSSKDPKGQPVFAAVFTSNDAMDAIVSYYLQHMSSQGWNEMKAYNAANKGAKVTSMGFEKGTRESLVIVSMTEQGAAITVQVAEKQ